MPHGFCEQAVLRLEVIDDESRAHPYTLGDVRDSGIGKTALRDHVEGGAQDLLPTVVLLARDARPAGSQGLLQQGLLQVQQLGHLHRIGALRRPPLQLSTPYQPHRLNDQSNMSFGGSAAPTEAHLGPDTRRPVETRS